MYKDQFETQAQFKVRASAAAEKYNAEARQAMGGVVLKLVGPIDHLDYKIEKTRWESSIQPVRTDSHKLDSGAVVKVQTLSTGNESRTNDKSIRSGKVEVGVSSETTSSTGMGLIRPLSSLLFKGDKFLLPMAPERAKQLNGKLAILIVGETAEPWQHTKVVSGDSIFAKNMGPGGTFLTKSYITRFTYVKPLCAAIVRTDTFELIQELR